jgi:hypothetical protein
MVRKVKFILGTDVYKDLYTLGNPADDNNEYFKVHVAPPAKLR